MSTTHETQPTLPGLELGDARTRGALRQSVVVTLEALKNDGLLEDRHAALAQLALEMADAVTRGVNSGKASAAAMAAGQLRETLLALPAPLAADLKQKFDDFVTALANGDAPS